MAKPIEHKKIFLDGYKITGLIGKGSFSEVYEGIQKVTGEKVGVKVVSKKNLTKGKVDDIVSEIGIMKSLNHPNIVKMIDFKWDEQNVYIVLEFCEGGNLLQYIKRLGTLPESICKRALQQLAMGLAYLRLKEICHMDLKPQNLLIKYNPFTVKIADFGLSQHLSDEAYTENMRGSPLYMAPEVLLKKKYNYKVDLWSVGIILYECLFGKAPFSNTSCRQLIETLQQEAPIHYPKSIIISEECMDLLQGLLKYKPHERMNYDDFFNHPFVDLIHAPTEENKKLAIHIIHEAVKYDEQKKYPEAFSAYCRALRYMVPIVYSLKNSSGWEPMHLKVLQCMARAEELKVTLGDYEFTKEEIEKYSETDLKTVPENTAQTWKKKFLDQMGATNILSSTSLEDPNKNANKPSSSRQISLTPSSQSNENVSGNVPPNLKVLFKATPKVCDALEIGSTGQMYMAEGDYNLAYNKFEASLNILIPHLKKEPPSPRKDLLVRQVQWWLTQAESAKALAASTDINPETDTKQKIFEATENCSIQ